MTALERLDAVIAEVGALYWRKRHFGYLVVEATVEKQEADKWLAELRAVREELSHGTSEKVRPCTCRKGEPFMPTDADCPRHGLRP